MVLVYLCFAGLVNSCSSPKTNSPSPWQTIVDSFSAVQKELIPSFAQMPPPDEDGHLEIRFMPIRFFLALDHLKLEPGYTLDSVYYQGNRAGFPILYTRKFKDRPYLNLEEYNQARGRITRDEYWARIFGTSDPKTNEGLYGYLNRVMIDNTPEGYFQFVVLRLMGSQFNLFWHAEYNDKTIVCSYEALEALVAKYTQPGPASIDIPDSLLEKASHLDLEPSIVFGQQSVTVKVALFTKWGGLIRQTFEINRRPPHRIVKESETVLLDYDAEFSY